MRDVCVCVAGGRGRTQPTWLPNTIGWLCWLECESGVLLIAASFVQTTSR